MVLQFLCVCFFDMLLSLRFSAVLFTYLLYLNCVVLPPPLPDSICLPLCLSVFHLSFLLLFPLSFYNLPYHIATKESNRPCFYNNCQTSLLLCITVKEIYYFWWFYKTVNMSFFHFFIRK